jgi:hypothetical protein
MLTGTRLGYKLPRRKLLLAYLAAIPLLAFVLWEVDLIFDARHGVTWLSGFVVVVLLVGIVEISRKWMRFVKEMQCTEIGIQANTLVGGNHDIPWARVSQLRNVDSGGFTGLVSLEMNGNAPFYLWLDEQTCRTLMALLREQSEAEITGFPDHLTDD